MRHVAIAVTLLTQFACPLGGWCAEAARTSFTIAGSGTNLPIMRTLAKAFQKKHPGITIEVPASIGSSSGIRAAADGAIAIGLISRPLKEQEKHLGLEIVTYAHTPLVIAVHPNVPDSAITLAEIIDIYRGRKRTWQNGKEIIVLTREPGDSTIEVMVSKVPGFRAMYEESQTAKRWTTLLKDLEMNETLAKTPNAIGFSDLGAITVEKHRIKPLKINGVAPTLRNMQEGRYPLVKPLMFVYNRAHISPSARQFLSFVRSGEGAKIMLDNGYLPEK